MEDGAEGVVVGARALCQWDWRNGVSLAQFEGSEIPANQVSDFCRLEGRITKAKRDIQLSMIRQSTPSL